MWPGFDPFDYYVVVKSDTWPGWVFCGFPHLVGQQQQQQQQQKKARGRVWDMEISNKSW